MEVLAFESNACREESGAFLSGSRPALFLQLWDRGWSGEPHDPVPVSLPLFDSNIRVVGPSVKQYLLQTGLPTKKGLQRVDGILSR